MRAVPANRKINQTCSSFPNSEYSTQPLNRLVSSGKISCYVHRSGLRSRFSPVTPSACVAISGLGNYVLGENFYRDTAYYDDEVPMDVPIPPVREISTEIRQATMSTLGIDKKALKGVPHTGTVAPTMRRDWEIERQVRRCLIKSRPVSVEMEAAYFMAAMFDMAIPAGVFLCASDSPHLRRRQRVRIVP